MQIRELLLLLLREKLLTRGRWHRRMGCLEDLVGNGFGCCREGPFPPEVALGIRFAGRLEAFDECTEQISILQDSRDSRDFVWSGTRMNDIVRMPNDT